MNSSLATELRAHPVFSSEGMKQVCRAAGLSVASQTCFSCLCPNTSRRQLKTSLESLTVSSDVLKYWSSSVANGNEGKWITDRKKKENTSHKNPRKSEYFEPNLDQNLNKSWIYSIKTHSSHCTLHILNILSNCDRTQRHFKANKESILEKKPLFSKVFNSPGCCAELPELMCTDSKCFSFPELRSSCFNLSCTGMYIWERCVCIVTHLLRDPVLWVCDSESGQGFGCVTRNPTSWTNRRSVCVEVNTLQEPDMRWQDKHHSLTLDWTNNALPSHSFLKMVMMEWVIFFSVNYGFNVSHMQRASR